jgi:hypothetical protein
MLKSKIAMALAAAMVMAALYGCSSSSNNDGKVTQLEGQVGTLTDNAADVLAKLRMTAEELELIVPADATAQAIADLIADYEPPASTTTTPVEVPKAAAISDAIVAESDMAANLAQTDNALRIAIDGLSATDEGANNTAATTDTGDDADTKLTKSMDSDALMGAGFQGAVFVTPAPKEGEDAPEMTDEVYVYTNKMANTAEEWNTYFSSLNQNGAGNGVDMTGTPADDADLNPLIIDTTDVSPNSALFVSDHLPNTPGTFMVYPEDDDATEDVDEGVFAGTFRGVDGMYECGSAGCRAERDADGNLTLAGTWTFTPTEGDGEDEVMVMNAVPDSDYLTFGFWLLKDDTEDTMTPYTLNVLYKVETPYDPNATVRVHEDVMGEAKYSGAATGKFTRTETNRDNESAVVDGGAFTATATLTAVFGTPDDVGKKYHNMVSGDIENFMKSGVEPIDDSWSVSLGMANFSSSGTNPFIGPTEGDDKMMGNWQGLFSGPNMSTGADPVPIRPSGIAGAFTGEFTNGNVAGAFGATPTSDE